MSEATKVKVEDDGADGTEVKTQRKKIKGVRSSREQLAWGLVGWMNFLALGVLGIIVAHVSGHPINNIGAWIAGIMAFTIFFVVGTLWLMLSME